MYGGMGQLGTSGAAYSLIQPNLSVALIGWNGPSMTVDWPTVDSLFFLASASLDSHTSSSVRNKVTQYVTFNYVADKKWVTTDGEVDKIEQN